MRSPADEAPSESRITRGLLAPRTSPAATRSPSAMSVLPGWSVAGSGSRGGTSLAVGGWTIFTSPPKTTIPTRSAARRVRSARSVHACASRSAAGAILADSSTAITTDAPSSGTRMAGWASAIANPVAANSRSPPDRSRRQPHSDSTRSRVTTSATTTSGSASRNTG